MPDNMTMEQWRLINKISKVQMAKKLNVHPITYDKYEANNGLMPIAKAVEFCKIVNQPIETVFSNVIEQQKVAR